MKRYEIKMAVKSGEQTFWRTIGTIFTGDDARLTGVKSGKPASFVIDYPACSGIIVKAETKDEKEKRQNAQNGKQAAEPEPQTADAPLDDFVF